MKYILILLFVPVTILSQTKINTISYQGGILTQEIIQNYNSFNEEQKIVQNKVIGINVEIIIDTIFKKYTILFTDQDQKRNITYWSFVRNYFPGKEDKSQRVKLYLMEDFKNGRWFLKDYLDLAIEEMKELVIISEELFPNNCSFLFRIKNAKRKE